MEQIKKDMVGISRSFDELLEDTTDSAASPSRGTCGFYTPERLRFKTTPKKNRQDSMDLTLVQESQRQIADDLLEQYDWTPLEFADASTQT